MENIKPLYDRIMVERVEAETKTAGGIILHDSAQEKPMRGRVIAVGDGTTNNDGKVIPLAIKTGDVVLFAKWGGTEIKMNNKEYLIMKESDVLAIVK